MKYKLFLNLCFLESEGIKGSQIRRPLSYMEAGEDHMQNLPICHIFLLTFCGRLSGQPRHSSVVKQVDCRGSPPSVSSWPHGENDSSLPSPKISQRIVQWLSTYTAVNDLVRS
jgi:hypothetical protein